MNAINNKLYDRCIEVDQEVLIEVMLEALNLMQQYNGRTINYCVEEALKNIGAKR